MHELDLPVKQLSRTYDACFGQPQFADNPLTPIDHIEQRVHIEISVSEAGEFVHAIVVEKEPTFIPVTEKSAGRTSGAEAHPLCDKLRYVAGDWGAKELHRLYREQLRRWAKYSRNPALMAVCKYVQRGTVVKDLLACGVLRSRPDGTLEREWRDGLSPLAELLPTDPATKQRDQGNAVVRWRVESRGKMAAALWKDSQVQRDWSTYNATLSSKCGFCMATGKMAAIAQNHPKRLRNGGDGAKLISSNDKNGYTFRGRFQSAEEALSIGSAATQKAHNALRWLIARQTAIFDDRVILTWAVQNAAVPPLIQDSLELIQSLDEAAIMGAGIGPDDGNSGQYAGDTGPEFALRLRKAMQNYGQTSRDNSDVVVMGMDSSGPGRMAILFYREMKGSELLMRIEFWHIALAWPQETGNGRRFIGAPALRDIIEAAYGSILGEELRDATRERLIACIVDGLPVPSDLAHSTIIRATKRMALEEWEFERNLGVACSLHKATHPETNYTMSLEESRTTRDYLFGRLLAVADQIEGRALWLSGRQHETNAARLMQRFAVHPCSTWRTLELLLQPHITQLRISRPGLVATWLNLIDAIVGNFQERDGQSDFLLNGPLSGEFLLCYHCQRAALRHSTRTSQSSQTNEGDEQ